RVREPLDRLREPDRPRRTRQRDRRPGGAGRRDASAVHEREHPRSRAAAPDLTDRAYAVAARVDHDQPDVPPPAGAERHRLLGTLLDEAGRRAEGAANTGVERRHDEDVDRLRGARHPRTGGDADRDAPNDGLRPRDDPPADRVGAALDDLRRDDEADDRVARADAHPPATDG